MDVSETNVHYWKTRYNFMFLYKVTTKQIMDLKRIIPISRRSCVTFCYCIYWLSIAAVMLHNIIPKLSGLKKNSLIIKHVSESQLGLGGSYWDRAVSHVSTLYVVWLYRNLFIHLLLLITSGFGSRYSNLRHFVNKYFHFSR